MSNKLYIDFTHALPRPGIKFHGGAAYVKEVVQQAVKYVSEGKSNKQIVLLWPQDYTPTDSIEEKIRSCSRMEIENVSESIAEVAYEKYSTLFLPLLGVTEFPILKKIKTANPDMRIILTIHGLRLLDEKLDFYNADYYTDKMKKIGVVAEEALLLPIKRFLYIRMLSKYVPYCNEIFTVSNYSLTSIIKYSKPKKITLFYESPFNRDDAVKQLVEPSEEGKYILFVSGNRPEKNLSRAMDAYLEWARVITSPPKMLITGVTEAVQNALRAKYFRGNDFPGRHIEFLDYVSTSDLQRLYRNAYFLLYPSKSEGFGLPVLEAALQGCPSTAAIGTSIPEVLGSTAEYFDPYSKADIISSLSFMSDPKNNKKMRKQLSNLLPALTLQMEVSNENLMSRLFR